MSTTPTQTLQLYLDLTQTNSSVNGLFADDNANGPRSKVWKNQSGAFSSDHDLVVSMATSTTIGLQVTVNLPSGYTFADISTGQCLRVTAVFGRDHKKQGSSAIYDSPFTISNVANGVVCTVFDLWFSAATLTSNPSVNLSFGTPRLSSSFPNHAKDQYAFIVAITLYANDASNNSHVYTAGHDPQMDIGD